MKKIITSLAIAGTLFAGASIAGEKEILATLKSINVETVGAKLSAAPVKGLQMALTKQGIFYVSDDGRYITQGPIYDMQSGTPVDIANQTVASLVNTIVKDAIVYKADNQRHVVTVFTDISCGYCKKLHEQMAEYNKLGITVRYLAFPRQGLDSDAGRKMQSIWSSADRKSLLDNAYQGKDVPSVVGMVPYVARDLQVGHQIGISGTPAIVLANGEVVRGYLPPEDLKKILDNLE
jgi:thiol:disulfide interchange protein DsbC